MSEKTRTRKSGAVIQNQVANGSAALIGYLPLGFPSVEQSIEAAQTMLDNGVDVIELGFPYSDPVMDGPIIQQATGAALERGVHLGDLLHAVEVLSSGGAPILSMTYWNPIHWYGVERFAKDFAAAGGAGLITPDLPPEEAAEWIKYSDENDLERVFLVAPSTKPERLKYIAENCRGWVYAAATMGVTGQRTAVDKRTKSLVVNSRKAGAETVCVGLGVSNGMQASEIGEYADGVIVGSAFVKCLMNPHFDQGLQQAAALAKELRRGVDSVKSR